MSDEASFSEEAKPKEERVRKSSLAQPGTKGRKKSVVSFSSEDTKTIEYEDGSGNASTEVDKFDEDKVPSPDPDNIPVRKFSRFNDSMKINKRRMSREEKPENLI